MYVPLLIDFVFGGIQHIFVEIRQLKANTGINMSMGLKGLSIPIQKSSF